MSPEERLAEFNNVSSPWLKGDPNIFGGSLVPHSWLFSNGQLIPYEFHYVPHDEKEEEARALNATLSDHLKFLEELNTALNAMGLTGTLGLRSHPSQDFEGSVEVTCGRANINFLPSQVRRHVSPGPSRGSADWTERCWQKNPHRLYGFLTPNSSRGAVLASAMKSPQACKPRASRVQNHRVNLIDDWRDQCIPRRVKYLMCTLIFLSAPIIYTRRCERIKLENGMISWLQVEGPTLPPKQTTENRGSVRLGNKRAP
jgi:hypothetical protein